MTENRLRPIPVPPTLPVAAGAILLAIAFAGCGGHATAPVKPVPLTLQAAGVGGATQRFTTSALLAPSATDTIPVTFTQALLVVRDVRFVLGGDDADTLGADEEGLSDGNDDNSDDGGQARFRGPYVVDLLAGTAQSLDTEMVLPGAYERVQGHLRALHDGDGPASAHSSLIGSTILLEGTIGGEGGGPFVYSARIDNEFMIRGDFTVAAETPATAFLVFDLPRFLTGREGRFLDPRVIENDLAIKQAIRHAIKIGMDDDHDGEIDDRLNEAAD
jgi:hypothetical protein